MAGQRVGFCDRTIGAARNGGVDAADLIARGAVIECGADAEVAEDLPFIASVHLVRVRTAQVGVDTGCDSAKCTGEVGGQEVFAKLREAIAVRVRPLVGTAAEQVGIEGFGKPRTFAQHEAAVAEVKDRPAVAHGIPGNSHAGNDGIPGNDIAGGRESALRENAGEIGRWRAGLFGIEGPETFVAHAESDCDAAVDRPRVLQEASPLVEFSARVVGGGVGIDAGSDVIDLERVDITVDVIDVVLAVVAVIEARFEVLRAAKERAYEVRDVGGAAG